jgi:hypothetical protein
MNNLSQIAEKLFNALQNAIVNARSFSVDPVAVDCQFIKPDHDVALLAAAIGSG